MPVEFTADNQSGKVQRTLYFEMEGRASAGEIQAYVVIAEPETGRRRDPVEKVNDATVVVR